MKKIILISLIIICNSLSIYAFSDYPAKEDSTEQIETVEKKNLLFLEIAGNGLFLSLNYERYISDNLSFRVGMGADPPPYSIVTFYPIMINYTFNLPFEMGFGIVPFSFDKGVQTGEIVAGKGPLIMFLFGFKKTFNWFLFKTSFTPFFNPGNSKIQLYGGLSFGYAF